jgi:hypothetical protein
MTLTFRSVALLGLILASRAAMATEDPTFTAKVFDQESKKQKLLFTYKHESEQKGDVRIVTNTYNDKDGVLAALETIEFVGPAADEKIRSYHMSQKQLGAEGDVKVEDGKVKFAYTKGGSTKTGEEKLTDDFVVGPSVTAFLQKHWGEIASGGKVKTRFAVADRMETVGFDFFKDHEETIDGVKTFAVKMKPSSFLISALVKPLFFFYSPDGKQLYEVHGRTQVKQKVDGSYHDLDAVTTYEYAAVSATGGGAPAAGSATGGAVQVPASAGGNSK